MSPSPVIGLTNTLLGNGTPVATSTLEPVSTTPTSAPATSTSTGGFIDTVTSSVLNGLFSSRVVAILLGLLLIGGALFLFGAQEIFNDPGGTVKRAAKAVAA